MSSFLVHAHGVIQGGSSKAAVPKFIVPEHTTIYFYCYHGSGMKSGSPRWFADLMIKMLLGPGWTMENERAVREDACKVVRAGDLCPNYYTETRSELDFPANKESVLATVRAATISIGMLVERSWTTCPTPLSRSIGRGSADLTEPLSP